jgi:DNA-binding HxlR family transcriptional regulator
MPKRTGSWLPITRYNPRLYKLIVLLALLAGPLASVWPAPRRPPLGRHRGHQRRRQRGVACLLVMRDVLLRGKSHYREFLASEERIATNILADRLARLEAAGLLVKTADDPRSGKQAYHATDKGKDLVPLLLEMMAWSAAHDPQAAVPTALIAALGKDRAGTARAIRDMGGIEAFLATAE